MTKDLGNINSLRIAENYLRPFVEAYYAVRRTRQALESADD